MKNQDKLENIVVICLIVAGVLGGTLFQIIIQNNQLTTLFFSLAFAVILYKLLGSAEDENAFKLGAMKFGGSAAILAGFILLLNNVVFDVQPAVAITTRSEENGQRNLRLNRLNLDAYPVIFETDTTTKAVGRVSIVNLPDDLFNQLGSDRVAKVFQLKPFGARKSTKDIEGFKYPFHIEVSGGTFDITDEAGEPLDNLEGVEVRTKDLYMIRVEKEGKAFYYSIVAVHANHTKEDTSEWYSEWVVQELKPMRQFVNN